MGSFVVDASVAVALFANEPATRAAIAFFRTALPGTGNQLWAPDALYYETAAALRAHMLRGGYQTWRADMLRLQHMHIETVPSHDLLIAAVDVSTRYMISVYDSFYIALAQQLSCPLITVDQRLIGAVQGRHDVRHVTAV
jgi:predicted nucleic acid-binding protein